MNKETDRKKSPWVELLFTLLIPTLVLGKFSGENDLGPRLGLIVAVAVPLGYGIFVLIRERRASWLAALGVVSIGAKGALGLMAAAPIWFALNEASVPGIFALVLLINHLLGGRIIQQMFAEALDIQKIEKHAAPSELKKTWSGLSFALMASFVISAVLNFWLALYFLTATPGSEAFNQQLAAMQGASYPVIVGSSMAVLAGGLWWFFRRLKKTTGLNLDELILKK